MRCDTPSLLVPVPYGITPDDAARLGLRRATLDLIAEHAQTACRFLAPPDVVAEFFLWLTDAAVEIDAPEAVAWWHDHGPTWEALEFEP